MHIKTKLFNKIATIIDFHSTQGKVVGGIIMGLFGAVLGALCANVVFTFSATGVHSTTLLLVTGGLLFLLFIDKVFL